MGARAGYLEILGRTLHMLSHLPEDMVRRIMTKCTARALTCLGSTCRRMRELAAEAPLPPVTLTCHQAPEVLRWLWSPDVARRVRVLVARRCLYGQCRWTARLSDLRSLTLAFCRVRSGALAWLPLTLRHLDMHQVLPPQGLTHERLSFARLRHLRSLAVVFAAHAWDAAFVAGLPKGLRRLSMRNCRALVIESFMPQGLRDVALHAARLLLMSNRLPNKLRRIRLECRQGSVWLKDTLPLRPHKLRHLTVRCPTMTSFPACTGALEHLCLEAKSLVVSAKKLAAAPRLRHVELHVKHYLAFGDAAWPPGVPFPDVTVTVDHVAVTRLPITFSPPHELGGQDGHGLGPDA